MIAGLSELVTKADSLRRPCVLVTLVSVKGSVPQKPGAHMLVEADGKSHGTVGGGQLEHHLIALSQQMLERYDPPRMVELDLLAELNMVCGGSVTAFLEPMGLAEKVVIFGCGHVCRQTAPMLVSLGFDVTVVDDRSEWADPGAFPDRTEVVCSDMVQYATRAAALANDRTWVLIMSRGHTLDYDILASLLKAKFRYIGVMASRTKRAEFLLRLEATGFAADVAHRIHIPVGLDIGSITPAEIAVSIAAQLVGLRNQGAKP